MEKPSKDILAFGSELLRVGTANVCYNGMSSGGRIESFISGDVHGEDEVCGDIHYAECSKVPITLNGRRKCHVTHVTLVPRCHIGETVLAWSTPRGLVQKPQTSQDGTPSTFHHSAAFEFSRGIDCDVLDYRENTTAKKHQVYIRSRSRVHSRPSRLHHWEDADARRDYLNYRSPTLTNYSLSHHERADERFGRPLDCSAFETSRDSLLHVLDQLVQHQRTQLYR